MRTFYALACFHALFFYSLWILMDSRMFCMNKCVSFMWRHGSTHWVLRIVAGGANGFFASKLPDNPAMT